MRVLLDTNIVLDVLLNRAPWVTESQAIWRAHEDGQITGYIAATTLTNIFYVARRLVGLNEARDAIRTCLDTFQICSVDYFVLQQASVLSGSDFEDNLQIACANMAGLDAIVTRDKAGFRVAPLLVLTPTELLARIVSSS